MQLKRILVGVMVMVMGMGGVGMAVAQRTLNHDRPAEIPLNEAQTIITGSTGNMADGPRITAQLDVEVEIDNFAALYAFNPDPTTAVSIRNANTTDPSFWDEANCGGGSVQCSVSVGNIGLLMVETSFHEWDILVRARNGGYLVRPILPSDAKGDEPIGMPPLYPPELTAPGVDLMTPTEDLEPFCVGNWTVNSVPPDPSNPFGDPTTVYACDSWQTIPRESPGIYLKRRGAAAGNLPVPVQLQLGIGTLHLAATVEEWSDFYPDITTTTIYDNAGMVESYAALTLVNGIASFAKHLGGNDAVGGTGGNTFDGGADVAGGAAGTTTDMEIAALNWDAGDGKETFGPIDDEYDTNMGSFEGIGNTLHDGPANGRKYPAMLFYINGMLDDTTPLTGNRNGTYTETLEFTFWGIN
jgi:hypothetical protein